MSPRKRTSTRPKYPFLYYGAAPADWFEGANDGHVFELRFRDAPDAATARALAARFVTETGAGPVQAARAPWGWSGRWARLVLGERFRVDKKALFARFQAIFRALHAVCPIDQVIFCGARAAASADAWTKWTVSVRPAPSPGPRSDAAAALFPRGIDKKCKAYAKWSAFEAARAAEAGAKRDAALAAFLAKPSGRLRFAPAKRELPRGASDPPKWVGRFAVNDADRFAVGPDHRVAIFRVPERGDRPLLFAEKGGKPRKTSVTFLHADPAWHPDGDSVFALTGPRELRRVDWKTGKSEVVYALRAGSEELWSVCAAGDRLMVGTSKQLVLLDPRAPERGVLASHKAIGYTLTTAAGGRLVAAQALMNDTTALIQVGDRALTRLATVPARVDVIDHDGRCFAVARGALLEISGLALDASPPRAAKAPGGKPALVAVAASAVVPEPEPTNAEKRKLGPWEWISRTAAGRVLAWYRNDGIGWIDDAGMPRRYEDTESRWAGLDAHRDGTIAHGGTFAVSLHHANKPGKPRMLELTGLKNLIHDVGFVGDDLAVVADKGLHVFDRAGKLLAVAKLAKGRSVIAFGDRLVVHTEAKDRVVVLERKPGNKLRKLAAFPFQAVHWHRAGDRCFLRDAADHWFELTGLS